MISTFRNIMAVITGLLVGSAVNMGLIKSGYIFLPNEGVDPNDMKALASIMPDLDFQYFIFPFLAHALGTLVGAFVAGLIAVHYKMKFSLAIGLLFLIGGIMMVYILPGPIWFAVADILLAYLPMAWIGGYIAMKI